MNVQHGYTIMGGVLFESTYHNGWEAVTLIEGEVMLAGHIPEDEVSSRLPPRGRDAQLTITWMVSSASGKWSLDQLAAQLVDVLGLWYD